MSATSTLRKDFLGRWLVNANPGTSTNVTDFLGRAIKDGTHDNMGRLLTLPHPGLWVVAHAYAAGSMVRRVTGGTPDQVFVAANAGTSHATVEPTWPAALYGSVVDNAGASQITWLRIK